MCHINPRKCTFEYFRRRNSNFYFESIDIYFEIYIKVPDKFSYIKIIVNYIKYNFGYFPLSDIHISYTPKQSFEISPPPRIIILLCGEY
jgi:hypothetical protein